MKSESSIPVGFFFNDTATTEIYTLSLHDALPIPARTSPTSRPTTTSTNGWSGWRRSEEHTSELQSRVDLVCRLLLEKKKQQTACLAQLQRIHFQQQFSLPEVLDHTKWQPHKPSQN